MALLAARADRSHELNWIQIGAVAGPTIELPSVALRSANFRLQGNGQGAVSPRAYLAELPSLIDEIDDGGSRSPPARPRSPTSRPPGAPRRSPRRAHRAGAVADHAAITSTRGGRGPLRAAAGDQYGVVDGDVVAVGVTARGRVSAASTSQAAGSSSAATCSAVNIMSGKCIRCAVVRRSRRVVPDDQQRAARGHRGGQPGEQLPPRRRRAGA